MEAWREELYHHGISGQKWGKRNGPPYPLDDDDHSAAEKKAAKAEKIEQKRQKYIKRNLEANEKLSQESKKKEDKNRKKYEKTGKEKFLNKAEYEKNVQAAYKSMEKYIKNMTPEQIKKEKAYVRKTVAGYMAITAVVSAVSAPMTGIGFVYIPTRRSNTYIKNAYREEQRRKKQSGLKN